LVKTCKNYLKEYCTIVEFRHVYGCLFDDDGPVSLEKELSIFRKVEGVLQELYPLFKIKLIICGLKMFGRDNIKQTLDMIYQTKDELQNLISGFDMVCEEDYNGTIDSYLDLIFEAREKIGDKF
jgi:hypothetical protein